MASGARGLVARFRAAPLDGPMKTIAVAAAVCLVCSLVVSTAAVLLRPRLEANRARERSRGVRALLQQVPGLAGVLGDDAAAGLLDMQAIDLVTGRVAPGVDPTTLDPAASDPEDSVPLPPDRDLAGLERRPRHAAVTLVRQDGRLRLVILPVWGKGFVSMLRGYVALDGDLQTIRALSFYEQNETPGLGAQVQDPKWLAQWPGTALRDADGTLRVRVARGAAASPWEVDGISGATYTGDGVTNLLRFWLGDDGYGPLLARLAREEGGAP